MEDFGIKLQEFEPDLLVVGGLQMMDNFPFQAGLAPMYQCTSRIISYRETFKLFLQWIKS